MEKDFLTVKEYAEIKGCSTQYVYRLLQTKLQPFVVVVDGRKCLNSAVLDEEVANNSTNATNKFNQVANGSCNPSSLADEEELKRINMRNEQIIDDLRAQLKEKDAQIKNQSEHIINLSSQITELFKNNQQLQLNYQLLLNDGKDTQYEEVHVEGAGAEEIMEDEPKRKGFFSRFFK